MSDLEIIPKQTERTTPVFETPGEHQRFREAYREAVGPALENARDAQRASWHEAQHRRVC